MKRLFRIMLSCLQFVVPLTGLLWLWPNTSLADDSARAKAKLREGRNYIAQEDYASALRSFQESYRLEPKGSVLFNIGMCYKALYRYMEAIRTFKLFITREDGREVLKEKARAAIKELDQLIGKVRLVGAPDGAEVRLNNKRVATTPLSGPLMVDPGQHSLQVSKEGYKSLKIDIKAVSGAVISVRAALTRQAALIQVDCTGEQAVVKLDGKVVGGCPYRGEVEPGLYDVQVSAPGRQSHQQEVEVLESGEVVVSVGALLPAEKAEDESGITISTWAWIGIAGTVAAGIAAGVFWGITSANADDFDNYSSDYTTMFSEDDADYLDDDALNNYWAREESAWAKLENVSEDTELFNGLAIATTALAGALAAGTVMLIFLDSDEEESPDLQVSATPCGVSMRF